MACVNPDGSISGVARKVLASLVESGDVAAAAAAAGLPVYRVRASLRELVQAGFVEEGDDGWTVTDTGRSVLAL